MFSFPNFNDLYQAAFQMMLQVLGLSLDFSNLSIVQALFENGYGLAILLSVVVAIVIVPAGIMMQKLRLSAAYSMVIVVLSTVVGAVWFLATSVANELGDTFTQLAVNIGGIDADPAFQVTTFGNPLIDPIMFAFLFLHMLYFVILFVGYEVAGVLLTLIGVIVAYVYGLGPRSRQVFTAIVSLLIVTTILGRPVVVATLAVGNLIGRAMPVDSVAYSGFVMYASSIIAMILQVLLFFLTYKATSHVVGKMTGSVKGLIDTIVRRGKLDATVKNKNQALATNRANRLAANDSTRRHRKAEITRASTATASSALTAAGVRLAKTAAAAGSKVHPATAVAMTITPVVVRTVGNIAAYKQLNDPPKKGGLDAYR